MYRHDLLESSTKCHWEAWSLIRHFNQPIESAKRLMVFIDISKSLKQLCFDYDGNKYILLVRSSISASIDFLSFTAHLKLKKLIFCIYFSVFIKEA